MAARHPTPERASAVTHAQHTRMGSMHASPALTLRRARWAPGDSVFSGPVDGDCRVQSVDGPPVYKFKLVAVAGHAVASATVKFKHFSSTHATAPRPRGLRALVR